MPAAAPPEAPPLESPDDPLAVALKAAAVQSAALVLLSAAQHVQRMTLLVEAATARALARLPGKAGQDVDDDALAIARASLDLAMDLFAKAQVRAHDVGAASGLT